MDFRRGFLFSLIAVVLTTSALGQDTKEKGESKPRRGFFSGIFKKDGKKPEPPKEEPKPKAAPAADEKAAPMAPAKPAEKEAPAADSPPPAKEQPKETPAPKAAEKPKESPKEKEPAQAKETAKPTPAPAPKPASEEPPKTQPKPEAAPKSNARAKSTPEPKQESKAEPAPAPKAAPMPKAVAEEPKPAPMPDPAKPAPAEASPPAKAAGEPVTKREAAMTQIVNAIRAASRQVEAVRKRRGQEPGDIVSRVDTLVKAQSQARLRRTQRVERALKVLHRPASTFQFISRIHFDAPGYSFDDSPDGRELLIDELSQLSLEGSREVERLLQLAQLHTRQQQADSARRTVQRALEQARAQVKLRPKDAAAHALLAEALSLAGEEARPEMLEEIEAALKLNPNHPHALLVRLIDQAARLREHLLREGPRSPQYPARDPREVMRRLYAQPPGDEALAAHDLAAADLRRLVTRVLDHADGKPHLMLRASAAIMIPELNVEIAKLARSGKARSFEQFEAMARETELVGAGDRIQKTNWPMFLERVMDSAKGDAELIAVVSAMPALMATEAATASGRDQVWQSLPEKFRTMFEKGMDRAAALGERDASVAAAKACEAVACLEFLTVTLGAKPRHEGLVLRAITLDPRRIAALDLLSANCAVGFPAASRALMEIRQAVLPGPSSLERCAAAAIDAEEWDAAERLLESALKLRPGHLETMNHLIAVRLMGAQTSTRFAEVETRFEKARAVFAEQEKRLPPLTAEAFVANYIVFLCLKEDWKSASEVFALSVTGGRFSDRTARDLAVLIHQE